MDELCWGTKYGVTLVLHRDHPNLYACADQLRSRSDPNGWSFSASLGSFGSVAQASKIEETIDILQSNSLMNLPPRGPPSPLTRHGKNLSRVFLLSWVTSKSHVVVASSPRSGKLDDHGIYETYPTHKGPFIRSSTGTCSKSYAENNDRLMLSLCSGLVHILILSWSICPSRSVHYSDCLVFSFRGSKPARTNETAGLDDQPSKRAPAPPSPPGHRHLLGLARPRTTPSASTAKIALGRSPCAAVTDLNRRRLLLA